MERYLVCAVVCAVLTLPLAVSWGITHTRVHQKIGTSPATFSLTTRGHSEVRLGIAGTVYVPRSRGPLGVIATVEGPGDPGAGDADLASYVRPEMLQLYTGLFHDPEKAVQEYLRLVQREFVHELAVGVLVWGGLGGLMLLLLRSALPPLALPRGRGRRVRVASVVVLALVTTSGASWAQLVSAEADAGTGAGDFALTTLDGTAAAGSTTNSPVLKALLGGALAKSQQLIRRQEREELAYREKAGAGLAEQRNLMTGPRDGELAVMMQSDMHCNTTMIRLQSRVWADLADQFGDDALSLMAVTGDLTTNGTAAEGTCIRDERAIARDRPVAAVTGNHESTVSESQMQDAGMTVLDGGTETVGGIRVLGDGDPERSELFGATRLRGTETQAEMGRRLKSVAEETDSEDRPDLVLVHEAYAAQAFLGVDDVRSLLTERGSSGDREPTGAANASGTDVNDDDVADVPASAVFYGHWHRPVQPRVLWNSDGTWTLLMELDTSGGAIDSPTIGRFSTPWSRPLQEASFPVVFLDEETRLVSGYQIYSFDPDGSVTVEPRVDIGPDILDAP